MKVLIVGSGGREHAIAWKAAQSPKVDKIFCAPGNAGIEEYAQCVNIGAMEFDRLVDFAKKEKIDLTIIGMDDPLVGGIVDAFEAEGLRVFGPRKNAAVLEGSKAFSKDLIRFNTNEIVAQNIEFYNRVIRDRGRVSSVPGIRQVVQDRPTRNSTGSGCRFRKAAAGSPRRVWRA